jgi:hypothetical protein
VVAVREGVTAAAMGEVVVGAVAMVEVAKEVVAQGAAAGAVVAPTEGEGVAGSWEVVTAVVG